MTSRWPRWRRMRGEQRAGDPVLGMELARASARRRPDPGPAPSRTSVTPRWRPFWSAGRELHGRRVREPLELARVVRRCGRGAGRRPRTNSTGVPTGSPVRRNVTRSMNRARVEVLRRGAGGGQRRGDGGGHGGGPQFIGHSVVRIVRTIPHDNVSCQVVIVRPCPADTSRPPAPRPPRRPGAPSSTPPAPRCSATAGSTVGVGEVASRAGVARSTIYSIFGSRAGLLHELFDDVLYGAGLGAVIDAYRDPDPVRADRAQPPRRVADVRGGSRGVRPDRGPRQGGPGGGRPGRALGPRPAGGHGRPRQAAAGGGPAAGRRRPRGGRADALGADHVPGVGRARRRSGASTRTPAPTSCSRWRGRRSSRTDARPGAGQAASRRPGAGGPPRRPGRGPRGRRGTRTRRARTAGTRRARRTAGPGPRRRGAGRAPWPPRTARSSAPSSACRTRRSAPSPGPGRDCSSADAQAKKQPPGKTRRRRWSRNESARTRTAGSPGAASRIGPTTASSKIASAVSIVASWSSSLDRKCAYSPLLLIPVRGGQVADRQPVQPLDGGHLGRRLEDRAPAARAVRALAAGRRFGLGCGHTSSVLRCCGPSSGRKIARPVVRYRASKQHDRSFFKRTPTPREARPQCSSR